MPFSLRETSRLYTPLPAIRVLISKANAEGSKDLRFLALDPCVPTALATMLERAVGSAGSWMQETPAATPVDVQRRPSVHWESPTACLTWVDLRKVSSIERGGYIESSWLRPRAIIAWRSAL